MSIKIEYKDCTECGGRGKLDNCAISNQEHAKYNYCDSCNDMDKCNVHPDNPICKICNGSGKIKTGYIIITDPRQASCFIGKTITFVYDDFLGNVKSFDEIKLRGHDLDYLIKKIGYFKVHHTTFKEALKDDLNKAILLHGLCEEECKELAEWGGME